MLKGRPLFYFQHWLEQRNISLMVRESFHSLTNSSTYMGVQELRHYVGATFAKLTYFEKIEQYYENASIGRYGSKVETLLGQVEGEFSSLNGLRNTMKYSGCALPPLCSQMLRVLQAASNFRPARSIGAECAIQHGYPLPYWAHVGDTSSRW